MAKLSVVVPFYNVERYIEASLESIARQTFRDLEVIMVDDGSTDGSTVIAKNFAARDPRFQLLQQHNQGLGPARNTGARHAKGQYLAFADSDDLVGPHAYELLTGSLEKTGSDLACGGVARLGTLGASTSWLHDVPFRKTRLRTHVSRFPVLLQDRTAWNKVFRRSFWDAHGFEFGGGFYEDGPVTLRAHVLASAVDVLRDVVYYWRVRETGDLSITQRSRELQNMEQRMASVGSVAAFLAASAPALKPIYDQSVLKGDLVMLVGAYPFASDAERTRLAELACDYLSHVSEAGYHDVPALRRLHYYLLVHGMLDDLLEVLKFSRRGEGQDIPVIRGKRRGQWCAAYPFLRDPGRGIPDSVYDVTGEMTLNTRLEKVTWREGKLRIEGHAYIRKLPWATPEQCKLRVTLRNGRTHRIIRLPAEQVCRPEITARSRQGAVSYHWSGFAVEIDPRRLATLPGVWRAASWELVIEVRGGGMKRKGPAIAVPRGSAQWPAGRWVTDDVWVQPAPEEDARFVIRGQQVTAFVTGCHAGEDSFDIEGWTTQPLASDAMIVISPRTGGAKTIRVPAEAGLAGVADDDHRGHPFRARVPVQKVVRQADPASPIARSTHVHDEFTWDVSISPGSGAGATRLAMAPGSAGARLGSAGREVTAFVTHFGYFSLLERSLRPVITELEWTSQQHLLLRGDHTDPGRGPAELLVRHSDSGQCYRLPLSWEAGTFTADLAPAQMQGLVSPRPLTSGNWNFLARAGQGEVTVALARQLLAGLPGYQRAGLHELEVQPYRTDAMRLNVRTALAEDESGRYAQRQLAACYFPKAAAQPLRDLAVFDSFDGRQYSGNPRAIYEELQRTHPDLECAWITCGGDLTVPGGGRVVLADTREHYETLARARYVVFNDMLPRWFSRREGQTCLQTWHGTPLKKIGLDLDRPQFASSVAYPDLLRAEVANWNLLISPNAFSTPIFRRAFGFDGEIVECGYPGNDALHQPDAAQRSAAIRQRLGLPADKRIALYAPTWRDDAVYERGSYRFELEFDVAAAAAALGDEYVLLLRLHANVRGNAHVPGVGSFSVDVTRYPDITDLYLISDVLITDYSSAMFDFAGTGRPMLFFTYDLERYRDALRGFYLDFEATAPGPLLATSAEVIEALRDIDSIERAHRPAYQEFAARFCGLDDGHAATRVVSLLTADR